MGTIVQVGTLHLTTPGCIPARPKTNSVVDGFRRDNRPGISTKKKHPIWLREAVLGVAKNGLGPNRKNSKAVILRTAMELFFNNGGWP